MNIMQIQSDPITDDQYKLMFDRVHAEIMKGLNIPTKYMIDIESSEWWVKENEEYTPPPPETEISLDQLLTEVFNGKE